MLADQANRARLCALCAFFLDETDFRADPPSAVGSIEHRIAVKIDFAAVGRFDEASLIPRQKLGHPTVAFRRVLLDLTAHIAGEVFDLA